MTRLITSTVANKILYELKSKESLEWFTELKAVKLTMASCEKDAKRKFPGFDHIPIFVFNFEIYLNKLTIINN